MPDKTPSLIHVLRHAHAARPLPGQSDFARPLDGRGWRQCHFLTEAITTGDFDFDIIITSPSTRTMQTLEGIGILPVDPRIETDSTLYEAEEAALYRAVNRRRARQVLLVAHNPSIENFALSLCSRAGKCPEELADGLSTASLVTVELEDTSAAIAAGSGTFRRLIRPGRL